VEEPTKYIKSDTPVKHFESGSDKEDSGDSPEQLSIAEKFRLLVAKGLAPEMAYMPPPPDLIRKSAVENEEFKTGAPIPFVKFDRLQGDERIE